MTRLADCDVLKISDQNPAGRKRGEELITVALGSVIEVELNGKDKMTLEIRRGESDPANGIISENAPIAKALLNAKEGEEREFRVGDSTLVKVRVLKIR